MQFLRFSLAFIMLSMVICGIAFAALANGSWLWLRVLFTTTFAILLFAILSAVLNSGATRAFWLGFALFGWGALALEAAPWIGGGTNELVSKEAFELMQPSWEKGRRVTRIIDDRTVIDHFFLQDAINSLFALLFALAGGVLGLWAFARKKTAREAALGRGHRGHAADHDDMT